MNNDRLTELLKRAKNLPDPIVLTFDEICDVQNRLDIELPKDFKELCTKCSYETTCLFGFFSFGINGEVIAETEYYRKQYKLPNEYIILAQQDDVSFIILKTISARSSEVIWCDYQDFFNICNNLPLEYNPTIFPTFTDFYEFLLDEEEKIRREI